MQPILNVQNLSKTYKNSDKPALKNLSFVVNKGDIFGLLGPNGAGKTTTVSILSGWINYASGSILYNDLELHKNYRTIKKNIGVVPQDIALYPTLTARENLIYFGRIYGLKGQELHTRVQNYIKLMGLNDRADQKINSFSGGMKRRTNLIAGILHQPQIIFLDEPTVGIDVHSKAVILEYLKELNAQGMTIIYTSHHLSEAEQFCNNVLIIDYGKEIAEGNPGMLINESSAANNLEELFLQLTGRELRD